MTIYLSQIYIEVGMTYPFSHHFQKWIGQELTKRLRPSLDFIKSYSEDSNLVFDVSAKSKITEPEIRGPTVFKRTKDVEYTIFLPHDGRQPEEPNEFRRPLELLLESIVAVLRRLGMDPSRVVEDSASLIEQIVSDPAMFTHRRD